MSCDVLLLGGSGFIGSALANRLKQEKITTHVIGRLDSDLVESVLPLCRTVVHLASATTPGSSANYPALEIPNFALTLKLLELMKDQPDKHLIFFSSGGTVYGNPDQIPVKENARIAPLSNYGAGKASLEAFFQSFRAQGHPVTILRPSNAYGPGQSIRSGFGLVRTMLEHVRRGTTLEIWGDGENVRDFIYVDDAVEACMRLIDSPADSHTYNLGSGVGYSINQVRGIVESVCGRKIETIYRSVRGIDVRNVVLDSSLLNARYAWQPTIDLATGIGRSWEWLQRR